MSFGPISIDHIGIAAIELEPASTFWRLLGLKEGKTDEVVHDQGVTTRFFTTDSEREGHVSQIELLEPTTEDTPIGRFLKKRGAGVQQVCFRVGNLVGLIEHLQSNGVQMIDDEPRRGAGGKSIAFVHPKSTGGVLVELTQY